MTSHTDKMVSKKKEREKRCRKSTNEALFFSKLCNPINIGGAKQNRKHTHTYTRMSERLSASTDVWWTGRYQQEKKGQGRPAQRFVVLDVGRNSKLQEKQNPS